MKVVDGRIHHESPPIVISLFDYSGEWSKPYRVAGYRVLQVDTKFGFDILNWNYKAIRKEDVIGVLAAPPCTDFALSGAQYWKRKDADGSTAKSVELVRKTIEIINHFQPVFHAIENPVGRFKHLFPELGKPYYFHPYEFGDPWQKKTCLWGRFNEPTKTPVEPIRFTAQGGWTQMLGGTSEKTKELRSITPEGFANAFFAANNPWTQSCG